MMELHSMSFTSLTLHYDFRVNKLKNMSKKGIGYFQNQENIKMIELVFWTFVHGVFLEVRKKYAYLKKKCKSTLRTKKII